MEALLPLFTGIMGALAAALGSWITAAASHRRERQSKRRERLLEAYHEWAVQLEDTLRKTSAWYDMYLVQWMQDEPGKAKALDQRIDKLTEASTASMEKLRAARVRLLLLEPDPPRRGAIEELTQGSEIKGWEGPDQMKFIAEAKSYRDRMQGPAKEELNRLLLQVARQDALS